MTIVSGGIAYRARCGMIEWRPALDANAEWRSLGIEFSHLVRGLTDMLERQSVVERAEYEQSLWPTSAVTPIDQRADTQTTARAGPTADT